MFYVWKFCRGILSNQLPLRTNTMSLGFFSLIGAVLCAVLSVAAFVGTREDTEIKATVLVSVGFFVLPVLSIIWVFEGE